MLTTGDRAPSFSLTSDSGKTVSSASLKGQRYVLYFYPKDDTPGCTKEACAFRDNLPAFGKLGVPVFGLSADDGQSHAKFAKKYALTFPLLSDPDHALLDAYGAWVEKNMYGRTYFGVQRSTFVVAGDGRIDHAWPKVSVDGHAEAVLAFLQGGAPAPAQAAVKPTRKTTTVKKAAMKKAPAKKTAVKKAAVKKAPATATIKKAVTKPRKTVAKKALKKPLSKR